MSINVRDFIREGTRDAGPGIQTAIDSLVDPNNAWPDESGGEIHFPKGRYIARTPIIVRCPGVIITGEGSPYSHTCAIEWQSEDPDAALFTFVAPKSGPRSNGFRMENIKIYGNKKNKSDVAFRFGPKERYCRDFVFDRVGISYFSKAFEFSRGSSRTWGGLSCLNCTFVYNGQVVDATQGGANEWRFRDCLLSKNGLESEGWEPTYAFDFFGGDNGVFDGCILEGQPRAIRARRFQQLRIIGCRFEQNATTSDPVVLVEDSSGIFIQAYHRVVPSEEKADAPPTILLRDCRNYEVKPMYGGVSIKRKWEGRY